MTFTVSLECQKKLFYKLSVYNVLRRLEYILLYPNFPLNDFRGSNVFTVLCNVFSLKSMCELSIGTSSSISCFKQVQCHELEH